MRFSFSLLLMGGALAVGAVASAQGYDTRTKAQRGLVEIPQLSFPANASRAKRRSPKRSIRSHGERLHRQ